MWPNLSIVICTYDRFSEINRTVEALDLHLKYPRTSLQWVIADDHSPEGYVEELRQSPIIKKTGAIFSITDENSGWAANVNKALRKVKSDYVFFIEDDYVLTQDLDLRVGLALFEALPHLGYLRYRGTAGGHIILHQMEADIQATYPKYQQGLGLPGRVTYCLLDSNSPDLYLYTHGPHLKRKSFHEFYGNYPEGLRLGETEEKFAHMVKDGMKLSGAPALGILPEWIPMYFDHIGQSYQHTEKDR